METEINEKKFFGVTVEELNVIAEKGKSEQFEKVCNKLRRDPQNGFILDVNESFNRNEYYKESIEQFGTNHLVFRIPKTFFWIVKQNLKDKSLILLFCGSVMSLILSLVSFAFFDSEFTYIESLSIFAAITAIVLISSITEYSQEKIFNDLERAKTDLEVKYIEDGHMKTKKVSQVLVGDLIFFEPGDIIPGDVLLVSNDPVHTDESLLTGESVEILKNQSAVLFSGSSVREGSGKGLVIAVGKNSSRGKILAHLKRNNKKTPLQINLEAFSEDLIKKSILVTFIIFSISTVKCALAKTLNFKCFMEKFIESVALGVTIIPEGLLMATTMALMFGSKRLLKEHNLVRDLSACEKMNNVSYLCTDKTGTLTHNRLVLRSYLISKRKFFTSKHKNFIQEEEQHIQWPLVQNMCLNSTAFKNQHGEYIGSRIESTILKLLEESNFDCTKLRSESKIINRQPFSSEKMYMSVIVSENRDCYDFLNTSNDERHFVFFKGAPEKILKYCKYEIENDELVEINQQKIKKFVHHEGKISQVRLAFAFAEIESPDKNLLNIRKVDNLIFTGCFSFEDPLRQNIEEKIKTVKQSGLKIIILTGDGPETAKYIAEVCGIFEDGDIVMTGNDFRESTKSDLLSQINEIRVIARATPTDKQIFVKLLQERNNIVAVTGDGANDGPALRLADVGFAIGSHASDIAKECSSIVILEKDFDSIISAISWGRCINDGIKKFFQLQFTATCATVIILGIFTIFSKGTDSLFSPVALLWINIYIDTLSAVALTSDKPDRSHISRRPQHPDAPMLTNYMKRFIVAKSLYVSFIVLFLYFSGISKTFVFNVFFLSIVFVQICSRSLSSVSPIEKILKNNYFLFTNIFAIIAHIFFIQKAGKIFHTEPLCLLEWIASICLASFIIPYHFFLKSVGFLQQ